MITHLHVQNFKCLRDVHIDLAPFTILIGPNDSGKSSLFDAIQFVFPTVPSSFQKPFVEHSSPRPIDQIAQETLQQLVWNKDRTQHLTWEFEGSFLADSFSYALSLSADHGVLRESLRLGDRNLLIVQKNNGAIQMSMPHAPNVRLGGMQPFTTGLSHTSQIDPLIRTIADSMASTVKYKLDPDALRHRSQLQSNAILSPTGDNLTAVLDRIASGPDRSAIIKLEEALHQEIPTVRGISLPAISNSEKALEFTLATKNSHPITISADSASDGALLLTAFLAIIYGNTPDIILIEEPENGLHPSRLKNVVEALRKITTGELGNRPRQVLIATQSPILLNYANPEEVRIFHRDLNEGTKVTPLTSVHDIDRLLKEFAIGELWYMLGEEALLKETPA